VRGLRAAALAALLLAGLLAGCTSVGREAPLHTRGVAPDAATDDAVLPCPDQADVTAEGDQLLPPLAFDCLGGGTLNLGRAPGVPTVVDLWASWCGPCRTELPLMQQLSDAAAGKVQVVGVVSKDGVDEATSFAADSGVTFPSAFDGDGELMTKMGLQGLPATFFLDAAGTITYTEIGGFTSYDDLRAAVADHLGVQL
jgi:cytochrome c biogenesis protein CcmG, thiol:disulfide interchange protein DsbE